MENQIIYGVFAIDVELPKQVNRKQQLNNLADAMKVMDNEKQNQGRFVRAYKKLEDAVRDCYDGNGWLIDRTLEAPDGVTNGKVTTFYFPKVIEVIL